MDGDPVIWELVGMRVEQAGFQPLLAGDASGARALDDQHHPELAIVGIDLGSTTSGLDLLCELKALRDTPAILLSGLSSVDIRVSDLEIGADDYLTKPFGDAGTRDGAAPSGRRTPIDTPSMKCDGFLSIACATWLLMGSMSNVQRE